MEGFDKEVCRRLPLAEAALRMLDYVCQEEFLEGGLRPASWPVVRRRADVCHVGAVGQRCAAGVRRERSASLRTGTRSGRTGDRDAGCVWETLAGAAVPESGVVG